MSKTPLKFKKIDPKEVECSRTALRPFGCMELWAGNERAHRSLELAGLKADVIAVPAGGDSGGDLSAVFSCSDNIARVVLADCVGHGYTASGVARHVHHLLHKFQDIRDTAGLLAALNDAFTVSNDKSAGPLRLTTVDRHIRWRHWRVQLCLCRPSTHAALARAADSVF